MNERLTPSETILESRLLQFNQNKTEVDHLMQRFRAMTVNIMVGDARIAKLCQTMTDFGCQTFESCEGHGKKLPAIWFFHPEKLTTLMRFVDIIKNSKEFHFPWQIILNGGANSSPKLSYKLEPSQQYGQINLPEDYENLMIDLDLITIKILELLENPLTEEEENQDVTKPRRLIK